MKKPAMLQINTAGSWRNVVEFDVADADAADHVMKACAALATYGYGRIRARVVKPTNGYPEPLMYWTPEAGWKRWRNAAGSASPAHNARGRQ